MTTTHTVAELIEWLEQCETEIQKSLVSARKRGEILSLLESSEYGKAIRTRLLAAQEMAEGIERMHHTGTQEDKAFAMEALTAWEGK